MTASAKRGTEDRATTSGDWIGAMRTGDFERAWKITDRDVALTPPHNKHDGPRHQQRIWRGELLDARRILVRCYHGLGDTLQFARFLPVLGRRARELLVWCQPPLLSLIETLEGVDRVIPLSDGAPDAEFDVDIEIMEVAHAVRATRDIIELSVPYLTLPPRQLARLAPVKDMIVGLVWEVGDWDKRRSVPAELLNRLNVRGVRLCSLQRGPAAAASGSFGAVDVSTADIAGLGHRMTDLDLIICVDTMAAHLAGALGLEAWIMLHHDCDWRWPISSSRSLWYPSARLFHQHQPGDWSQVVEDIRSALVGRVRKRQELLQSHKYGHAPGATAASEARPALSLSSAFSNSAARGNGASRRRLS
jgi:hypothetical protein